MKKVLGLGVLAALVVLIAGVVLFLGYRASAKGSPGGRPVSVVIARGASGGQIARELQSRGVVGSALALRVYLRLSGIGAGLRPGVYRLRETMPFSQLVAALRRGPPESFVELTIPEGFTLDQVATRVGNKTRISKEAFLAAASPSSIRPSILPQGTASLEGFLFPKTYRVTERESADDLVKRMVAQFEKEASGPLAAAPSHGLTPFQALIVASMVEREAKAPEDRPLVAAVIENRLRLGMKLEIDATVQYALDKYDGTALLESDRNVDSPYNTYKIPALPPGPIASPGLASIEAVLAPAQSDAIYYVLTADCIHHFFTKSFQDFQREKAHGCR